MGLIGIAVAALLPPERQYECLGRTRSEPIVYDLTGDGEIVSGDVRRSIVPRMAKLQAPDFQALFAPLQKDFDQPVEIDPAHIKVKLPCQLEPGLPARFDVLQDVLKSVTRPIIQMSNLDPHGLAFLVPCAGKAQHTAAIVHVWRATN